MSDTYFLCACYMNFLYIANREQQVLSDHWAKLVRLGSASDCSPARRLSLSILIVDRVVDTEDASKPTEELQYLMTSRGKHSRSIPKPLPSYLIPIVSSIDQ